MHDEISDHEILLPPKTRALPSQGGAFTDLRLFSLIIA
jgi:hypothetical protein